MKTPSLKRLDWMAFFESELGICNGDPDNPGYPRMTEDGYLVISGPFLNRLGRNQYERMVETGELPAKGNAIHIQRGARLANVAEEAIAAADPKEAGKTLEDARSKRDKEAEEGKKKTRARSSVKYPEEKVHDALTRTFIDDAMYGSVLTSTVYTAPSIHGAVTTRMGMSLHPVELHNMTNTRMASDSDAVDRSRDFARSKPVRYALIRTVGTFDAFRAEKNHVDAERLKDFSAVYLTMCDNATSNARGTFGLRELIVVKHKSPTGSMSLIDFKDRLKVRMRNGECPRSFADIELGYDDKNLPPGAEIIRLAELRGDLDWLVS